MNIETLQEHYRQRMEGISGAMHDNIATSIGAGAVPRSMYDLSTCTCTCSLYSDGDAGAALWTVPFEPDEAQALGNGVTAFLNGLSVEIRRALGARLQSGVRMYVSLWHDYEAVAEILVEVNGSLHQLGLLDTAGPAIH